MADAYSWYINCVVNLENALKMTEQVQNESKQLPLDSQGFYSNITNGFGIYQEHSDVFRPDIMQLDRSERLKLAVGELSIGKRIHEEVKRQGRNVAWLARQLGVERTSLYYTFRQNSIDVELLLRISYFLEHNFLQDMADMYKSYGI